ENSLRYKTRNLTRKLQSSIIIITSSPSWPHK
ncbi:MAG: hypothetical protein ACI8RD_008245, partial [Bacillariaceae sp.]